MAEEKEKKPTAVLPPGMIPPTMAARITHFWHALRVEGMQERAKKRAEALGDGGFGANTMPLPMNRKERRLSRKSKSRKPKTP